MAKLVQKEGAHAELRNMANEVVAVQSSEIEMMQGWLQQWGYEN
jgi:uncharacterized protein (DUF305 family)